ncbi:helix-turn-helix domain-containing protein [Kitasatospora sp. NPDC087861]|uniref:helix-turn-helix domain-containing protein n=1 Tax=Kitasatospora sp. NPDC087861 TaxID=3364070 RepID=UPI00381587C4
MTETGGPTVRRRTLGTALTELRESAGLQQKDAASALGCSASKVSRIEQGKGLIKQMELRTLLELYGVSDESKVAGLLDLARRAAETGWWEQTEYESIMPQGLGVYVGLENDARTVRAWELGWVPGLLQHEDYAAAVLAGGKPAPPETVRRLLEIREKRQGRLLAAEDSLELWAIMDESVLMRPIGDSRVMAAQIKHLQIMAERPNVTLQILPLSKGMNPGLRGSFSILEFAPNESPIIYVESPAGNTFLERDHQIMNFRHDYSRLTAGAMDPPETMDRLRKAAEEFHP